MEEREHRGVALLLAPQAVVEQRRDDLVLALDVLTVEVEGCDAEIELLSRPRVTARAALPRAEQRANQVEATLAVVLRVSEQRRDQGVAAVLALAGEVQGR